MHITAFGQHRLEATAPWSLIQEKQGEEEVPPSGKKKITYRFGALRHAVAR
jgi:hypothetical protein